MISSPLRGFARLGFAVVLLAGSIDSSRLCLAAAAASVAPAPLTTESLQVLVSQNKVTPAQAKILQADIDYIAAARQKLADLPKLPPDQARLKPNVLKYESLQRELMVGEHKLAADQLKLTAVPPTPTPTPKPRH